jgi:Esterase/lipase
MNRVEFVFWAIDVFADRLQNYFHIDGIKKISDFPYGEDEREKADFYYKEGLENMPVLINVHGGGFVKGGKEHRRSLSEAYAEKGFFVINISYRLCPKNPFPAIIEDAILILNKLEEIGKTYPLDIDKVVLTGDSSGAYASVLATAALYDGGLGKRLGLPECKIRPSAVAAFSGLYNIRAVLDKKFPFRFSRVLAESFTGEKLGKKLAGLENYKFLKEISPVDYVNSNWPPVFVSYSKKDIFVAGQGELFIEKLKEKGVPYEEAHSEKIYENHCYHLFNFKAARETMGKTFEFLDKVKNA